MIKQLDPQTKDPYTYQVIKERFEREAVILEKLGRSQDQIPELYDFFSEGSDFYLVQEFIQGQTLLQWVKDSGRLSGDEVKNLLISLLAVLDYIHGQGVIHRDVKPDNVVLREPDRKPVLIDFGAVKEEITKVLSSDGNSQTIVIGTPGYMPQEQEAGQPVPASDIYSLGLTAIFLLTGKHPSKLRDPKGRKFSWRSYAPGVDPRFAGIIDKAIQPLAKNRYQTAKEMLRALQPPSRKAVAPAKPASSPRKPAAVTGAVAIVVIIAIVMVFAAMLSEERARSEKSAQEAREAIEQADREKKEALIAQEAASKDAQERVDKERAARESAEKRAKELEEVAGTGNIQSVRVDHNVFDNNKLKGMRIHVKFNIRNFRNVECVAAAYFEFASGETLKGSDKRFEAGNGQVAVSQIFTPGHVDTFYEDLTLFIPYDEIYTQKGTHQLRFIIHLYRPGGKFITGSTYQTFTLNNP